MVGHRLQAYTSAGMPSTQTRMGVYCMVPRCVHLVQEQAPRKAHPSGWRSTSAQLGGSHKGRQASPVGCSTTALMQGAGVHSACTAESANTQGGEGGRAEHARMRKGGPTRPRSCSCCEVLSLLRAGRRHALPLCCGAAEGAGWGAHLWVQAGLGLKGGWGQLKVGAPVPMQGLAGLGLKGGWEQLRVGALVPVPGGPLSLPQGVCRASLCPLSVPFLSPLCPLSLPSLSPLCPSLSPLCPLSLPQGVCAVFGRLRAARGATHPFEEFLEPPRQPLRKVVLLARATCRAGSTG